MGARTEHRRLRACVDAELAELRLDLTDALGILALDENHYYSPSQGHSRPYGVYDPESLAQAAEAVGGRAEAVGGRCGGAGHAASEAAQRGVRDKLRTCPP